jgi:hypothetical protein
LRDDSLVAALSAPLRNLELKARDADPRRSLELALAAEDRGEIEQRDTYFARARPAEPARAGTGRRRADREGVVMSAQ